MKPRIFRLRSAAALLLAAYWAVCNLAACGEGSVAGTDAGNADKVAGTLTDTLGLALSGRLVQMRSADFQGSPADSLLGLASPGKEWSDTTGLDGSFAFTLGLSDTGDFVVEALLDETKGTRAAFHRAPQRFVALGALAVRRIGGINGTVKLPATGFGDALVSLLGTHQCQYFPAGSGAFAFYSLPPGQYRLRVQGVHPVRNAVDTAINVAPGNTVAAVSLTAGQAPDSAAGAVSLRLTFPVPLTGALRARLDGTGAIQSADSSGSVSFPAVPPGTYSISAWGENPIRDTLRLAGITVKPGLTTVAGELRFKIKALIVDGIANHDWQRMTQYNSAILQQTGIFDVAASTSPPDKSGPDLWAQWNPKFSDHDVAIIECNSGYGSNDSVNPWPDSIKARLEAFVAGGGGLVNTHATFPSWSAWPAYNEMQGLNWIDNQPANPSYILDSLGMLVADSAASDPGTFESAADNGGELMAIVNPGHPINRGLPALWLHPASGLIYRLKGNPAGVTVLAYTVNASSKDREPQQWVKNYGKGRVFNNALGHIYPGDANTHYRCAGYQTTFARGAEWAASGQVTLPLPSDFPGKDSVSLRNNLP